MAKIYRTAMGKTIDVDNLRLSNEHVIAVGNMKVNARGDELGPGGKVVKTRDQVMKEYYALNTPTATEPVNRATPKKVTPKTTRLAEPARKDPAITIGKVDPASGLDEIDQSLPVDGEVEYMDPAKVAAIKSAAMQSSMGAPSKAKSGNKKT